MNPIIREFLEGLAIGLVLFSPLWAQIITERV